MPDRPGHLEIAYTRVGMIGPALAPRGRILFVGLGGGSMPRFTRRVLPDARVDAVEIDPLVVDAARRFFGVAPDSMFRVHTGDGRAFIEAAPPASWDVVVLDAYADDAIPRALATVEFLRAVAASLAPGGVVAANLWSENPLYDAMLATYVAAFHQVRLVRVPGRPQRIVLAADASRALDRDALVAAARALAARAPLGFDLPGLVAAGYEGAPPAGAAPVLSDADG
jgi:spermidine synthase